MTPHQLDRNLNKVLDTYVQETQFNLDTFDQVHPNEFLTRDDMEEMNRSVYYALWEFKQNIVKCLKDMNR